MAAKTWGPADKLAWQRARIAEHIAKGQLEATPNIKSFIASKPMTFHGRSRQVGFKRR